MAFQEALILIINKSKTSQTIDKHDSESSFITEGLKYLFDCFNRVEEEKLQYSKVKNNF